MTHYYNSRPFARSINSPCSICGSLQFMPLREGHERPSGSCTEFLRLQLTPIKNGHHDCAKHPRRGKQITTRASLREAFSIVQNCCSIQALQLTPLYEGHHSRIESKQDKCFITTPAHLRGVSSQKASMRRVLINYNSCGLFSGQKAPAASHTAASHQDY